jgi:molecular chaperone IbpA
MTHLSTLFGKDFERVFVGFGDQVNRLQKLHDDVTKHIPTYPPYNIRKTGENTYVVEMAVAGFSQDEIDIEIESGKLIIRGNVSDNTDAGDYLFRGIATRAFTRSFALDDQVEVRDAELFNGMLKISLERLVPEEKKPQKVMIKSLSSRELLNESKKK